MNHFLCCDSFATMFALRQARKTLHTCKSSRITNTPIHTHTHSHTHTHTYTQTTILQIHVLDTTPCKRLCLAKG